MQEQAMNIFSSSTCHPAFKNIDFKARFMNTLPHLLNDLVSIINFFHTVPISCVVVGTTEDSLSRSIVAVASAKGIPSICMQHGLIIREDECLPIFSTKQAVYGKFEKEWCESKGVTENRIEIIGHPRFDEIFTKRLNRPLHKIWKKSVLIATQPDNRAKWKQLINCLMKDTTIEIIIKPHPIEIKNKDYLSFKMLSSGSKRVKLISNPRIHLYDILASVNVVVVDASTVGLEAMLMGKTVVVLKNDSTNYYDKLGNFVQPNPEILAEYIKKVLRDPYFKKNYEKTRQEFISYAYPQQLSIHKLLNLIDDLTNEK